MEVTALVQMETMGVGWQRAAALQGEALPLPGRSLHPLMPPFTSSLWGTPSEAQISSEFCFLQPHLAQPEPRLSD